MKNVVLGLGLVVVLAGCSGKPDPIQKGSDVSVQKSDGGTVAGRVVEVTTEDIVVETRDGAKLSVPRAQIATVKTLTPAEALPDAAGTAKGAAAATSGEAPAAPAPVAPEPPSPPRPDDTVQRKAKIPELREVTVPAGTVLRVMLSTPVASDASQVEDAVRATLQNAVTAEGIEALPAGTTVVGHVTSAQRSAKVKGRASVGFRFNRVDLRGDGGRESIQTATITRVAATTKKKDAAKIGIGAGAGAVIGGIMGGGSGAAKGAAIGGGAGTGAVLATRGDEVRLPAGTPLSVKLTAPLTVRVPR